MVTILIVFVSFVYGPQVIHDATQAPHNWKAMLFPDRHAVERMEELDRRGKDILRPRNAPCPPDTVWRGWTPDNLPLLTVPHSMTLPDTLADP